MTHRELHKKLSTARAQWRYCKFQIADLNEAIAIVSRRPVTDIREIDLLRTDIRNVEERQTKAESLIEQLETMLYAELAPVRRLSAEEMDAMRGKE